MATRQEELQNLCKMRDTIKEMERLEERLKKEEEAISKQSSRKIDDYPEFVSSNWKEKQAEVIKKKNNKVLNIPNLIAGMLPLIYILATHIIFCISLINNFDEMYSYITDGYIITVIISGILELIFCLVPPILVGFLPLGGAIAALMQYLASRIWCGEDQLSTITPEHFVNNAKIFLLSIPVFIVVYFIFNSILKSKAAPLLKEAEENI